MLMLLGICNISSRLDVKVMVATHI